MTQQRCGSLMLGHCKPHPSPLSLSLRRQHLPAAKNWGEKIFLLKTPLYWDLERDPPPPASLSSVWTHDSYWLGAEIPLEGLRFFSDWFQWGQNKMPSHCLLIHVAASNSFTMNNQCLTSLEFINVKLFEILTFICPSPDPDWMWLVVVGLCFVKCLTILLMKYKLISASGVKRWPRAWQ